MSDYDVYEDEMLRGKFSDQDVERIFSGQVPDNEALAALPETLKALFGNASVPPSEGGVQRLAAEAADIARSTRPQGAETLDPVQEAKPKRPAAALRGRLAVVGIATFVLAGMTGVAIAANGAAPGDALYGLDRALERVGINNGASQERIDEAKAMAEAGMIPDAMRHVVGVVDVEDDQLENAEVDDPSNAAEALLQAADQVQTGSADAESQAVRDAVAAMLTQMSEMVSDPTIDGATFGQTVSEMARNIGGNGPEEEDESGPPDRSGPPDGAGPPDGVGPPDGAGPQGP